MATAAVRGRPRVLDACEIDARTEMERHWGAVRDWLVAIFRYQGIEDAVAEELALLPGAEELAALLAVEDARAAAARYDLVVVDCAPTGCDAAPARAARARARAPSASCSGCSRRSRAS